MVKAHLVQVLQLYAQKLQEWDSPPSSASQGSPSGNMLGSSAGAKSLNAAEQLRAIRAQAAHENRPIGVGLGASYAQTVGEGASVGPAASAFVPLVVQKKQLQQQQQQQQSSASAGPAAGVGLRRGGVAQTSLTNVTGTVSTAAEQIEQQHVGGDDSSSAAVGTTASSGGSGGASSSLTMLASVLGSRLPPNFSHAQLAAALGNLSGSSSAINTDQLQMLVHQLSSLNIATASSASDSK